MLKLKCTRKFVNDPLHILKDVSYKCVIIYKGKATNSLHNSLNSGFEALLVEQLTTCAKLKYDTFTFSTAVYSMTEKYKANKRVARIHPCFFFHYRK